MFNEIIKAVNGTPINNWQEQYEDESSGIQRRNGTVLGAAKVPYDKIERKSEEYQIRQKTTDTGHLSALTNSIMNSKLRKLPIVCFVKGASKVEDKFHILSGHHRVRALNRINIERFDKQYRQRLSTIPVLIVEFSDDLELEFWLQEQNKHPLAKPAGIGDAVLMLRRFDKKGYFKNVLADDLREKAKALIKEYHPSIHGGSHEKILTSVWEDPKKFGSIRRYTPQERRLLVQKIGEYDTPMNSGEWVPNESTCVISGEPNSIDKAIFNALVTAVKDPKPNEQPKVSDLKIYAFFKKGANNTESLKQLRNNFLLHMTNVQNKIVLKTGRATIVSIDFLEQDLEGENGPLSYVWNKESKNYSVKTSNEEVANV